MDRKMAHIVFLQNIWFEFMGPMYLSASLRSAGHDCRLLIGDSAKEFLSQLTDCKPDIIAFSVMTGMHGWVTATARELKNSFPDSLVVLGGPHATFFPDVIENDGIDIICRGEGEEALLELADACAERRDCTTIENLWVKKPGGDIVRNGVRNLRKDLDTLQFPDRSLYASYPELAGNPVQVVISSRGCPYDCTFCFNHQMVELYRGKGRYVRHRSPASVIAEIEQLKSSHSVQRIYFADDTFALDRNWLKEFLPLYGKLIALPFHCLVRINQLDEEITALMRSSGCETVFFGIESGDETIRNSILKKEINDSEIIQGAALLKKHGITFRTYNIIGFPGETLEQAMKTVLLNIAIATDHPWCSLFMPYPGTRLAEFARENGYIKADLSVDSLDTSFHISSIIENPDRDKIVNLHKFFQTAVLFPSMLPLIKRLICLPDNPLFRLWFGFIYFIVYIRSEGRGFIATFRTALHNGQFFRKR